MKNFLSIILLLGFLFTTNAQADEITNAADMFAVPIVELQELETNFDQIDNDIDEGLHIFYQESDRQLIGDTQSGFGQLANLDFSIEGQTLVSAIGRSYSYVATKWRPLTGELSLQRTGAGDTYLSTDHNTLERNDNDFRANHKQRGGEAHQLAYASKMAGHRCAFMESDGHTLKIH